jgi:LysR family transcriptional regulator of beta-lactamase
MRRKTKLSQLPLNALRAFEVTARTLSFTRAGLELRVTQAAVSQQVKLLEDRLGAQLFRRLPRGVALTDEGQLLLPSIVEAFRRLTETLDRFEDDRYQDVISVGVVGTFASGWLFPRLASFRKAYPRIDLRLFTNNNRVDLAGEGLDYAIKFGDGLWHGTEATHLLAAPFSPFCAPTLARKLTRPADLKREVLPRSYRDDEWPRWFAEGGTGKSGHQGNGFRFVDHNGKRGHARLRCCITAGGDVSGRSATPAAGAAFRRRSGARRLLDDAAPVPAAIQCDALVQELVARSDRA